MVIREIQIKTTTHLLEWLKIKKQTKVINPSVVNLEQLGMQDITTTLEKHLAISHKVCIIII